MHERSGARDDLVSSHNCDRRFHFFKATSHTIAFCTRESAMFFFFWTARESAPDMPEARLKSHVNRCHISAGTHKFKSAVLLSGVPFQKPTLKKLEHILSCKSSRSCPKLLACVPIGVPCPKWMSCKCAVIVLYISNKMKKIIALPHSWESKYRYNHILLLQATKMSDYPHQGRQYLKMSTG